MLRFDHVDVTRVPGGVPLRGITFTIRPGEVVAVTGPRGAGKSTLMRCATGLIDPTRGRVLVDEGQDLRDRKVLRRHLLRTGMMLTVPPLRGGTVLGMLLGTALDEGPFRRSDGLSVLDRVGLLVRALDPVHTLSPEELQRFALARVLLGRPDFVLACEPTGTLEAPRAGAVLSLLRRLALEDGMTVLLSITRQDIPLQCADRVLTLESGRVTGIARQQPRTEPTEGETLEIRYCGGCGKRLTRDEFARKGARVIHQRPSCGACLSSDLPPARALSRR
jgi:ABC-type phosphate/phosphonate transport system ATPase subunit